MGVLDRIFGRKKEKKPPSKHHTEKDNMGMRQETISQVEAYWISRGVHQKFDPFVLYVFDRESDAREALLELECIQIAQDTGKLICTETLIFGHYRRDDGKYEAIVAGEDLTHELWKDAKNSFGKHGGKRKNDKEPEARTAPTPKAEVSTPGKVFFVREDRTVRMGQVMLYRIHKGPDAASAKAFLQENPVTRPFYYIVVETPEGNYVRDIEGIYKE